jgi:HK97 family phage major capsid protein
VKIWSSEVSRRPPADAIVLRASARAEPVQADDRIVTFCASDPSVGRDGHTIAADAWQTANFMRNPVFLWAHQSDDPPIGRVKTLFTVGSRLMASVEYAEREAYPFADTIFQLVKRGFLNAVSAAWLALEWRAANDRSRPGGLDFTKVELLELSQVPVPALPSALAAGRAAGIDTKPFIAWAERALDRPGVIDRKEIIMIRNAAGAAAVYAMPRRHPERDLAGGGFKSFGDFLQSVARASGQAPAQVDPRLTRASSLTRAPATLYEADPTAGGFTVPGTYVESLVLSMYDDAVIAPLCEQFETDLPNTVKLPGIDETSRADGSRWGGATAYWSIEAPSISPSMPKYKNIEFGAHKLYAVCFASNELIADAPMLGAYVRKAFAAEMSFKLDAAILRGTGAGVPIGVLNCQSLITIAKDNSQPTQTISTANIENMWAALPVPCRRRAVWLCNELAEKQLANADYETPASAALYIPAGVGGNEYPVLHGRPMIQIEQAEPLGTPGDIILADFSQYGIVSGGLKANLSMEADFLHDQGVFRFAWRVDGQPFWSSPIISYSDGAPRSPFIALAQR